MKAVGYARVSTDEQGVSGLGLEAQEAAIRTETAHRGWRLEAMHVDVASGSSMRKRGELGKALRMLGRGDADVLVVAKLDRLSRSRLDFATLLETAAREGWAVTVLDLGVDTTTSNGRLIMSIMIALAQWEREAIGDRTKKALEQVVAKGGKLGRRSGVSDETRHTIRALRAADMSWQKVADALTATGVPTAQGGRWHANTVRRLHAAGCTPLPTGV